MRSIILTCSVLALLWLGGVVPSAAQEWTRFRGPNGTGQTETVLPASFTPSDFLWKVELPGIGHASPVIWGDKLFTLSADPKTATRYVVCLDAKSGKQLWVREYPSAPHNLHDRSSYASSTPTVDAKRVYVAWSEPRETTLLALNHDGSEAWRLNLGRWVSQHGFGTSPILYDGMVIFYNSQDAQMLKEGERPGETNMMAFDCETGRELWRSPRPSTVVSYSVPCIYEPKDGAPQLVCCQSNQGIFALDPHSGSPIWSANVLALRSVSSPVLAGGLIFGSTGSGGGGNYLAAVRPGPKPELAYEIKKEAGYVPTSVARGDLLFVVSDGGVASCIDAPTGEKLWNERIEGTIGISGSTIRAGDKVYFMDDDGTLVALAADKEFKLLGRSPLGEPSRSTPAVADGKMYLRTYSHLICVGSKTK